MKKILFLLSIAIIAIAFFEINHINYQKHIEIKQTFIKHPEKLPTKETAYYTSLGFKNLRADWYWLEAIQYIGSNAISSEYKKYLFVMLDLITELNPYFEHPYTLGQLIIPSYNQRYENRSEEERNKYIEQAMQLGLKGIENFCDENKITLIEKEFDLRKIWTLEKYKNPCKSYAIPSQLGFIYQFYKKEPLLASKYYKIASANENSLDGTKILAAIMQGKGGEREKAFFMFLNIAKFIDSQDQVCNEFAQALEQIGTGIFIQKNIPLSGNVIKEITSKREEILGTFDASKEDEILSDTKCINYVNKATREINLAYIETANKQFEKEHEGRPAIDAKALYNEGYINYLPIDFQQYENQGIVYEYNYETKNYDYKMKSYNEYFPQ